MDEKRKNQIKLILEFDVKSTAQIFMPCWKAGIIQFLSGKWNLFTCKCVQVFLPSNNGCHANPMFRARCSCKISSNIRILTAWKFGLEDYIQETETRQTDRQAGRWGTGYNCRGLACPANRHLTNTIKKKHSAHGVREAICIWGVIVNHSVELSPKI